jgi:hypothetical protein
MGLAAAGLAGVANAEASTDGFVPCDKLERPGPLRSMSSSRRRGGEAGGI